MGGGVLVGDQIMVVHHAFRPEGVVQALETGATLPWNATALGKAVVAFAPGEQQKKLLDGTLPALTGRTVTDPEALRAQLEQVRDIGYAVESQELTLGDAGIAAPIFERTPGVAGAIGLVGPVERLLDEERRQAHAIATRETARNLSRELGGFRAAGGCRPSDLAFSQTYVRSRVVGVRSRRHMVCRTSSQCSPLTAATGTAAWASPSRSLVVTAR
ncbi:hypothetical protein GCM10020256_42790 [Streptomyces thermocoprophilus]